MCKSQCFVGNSVSASPYRVSCFWVDRGRSWIKSVVGALFAGRTGGMSDCYEPSLELRALAMRVAALEDNVAFLEQWCEEQQDALDRAAGPLAYDYEVEPAPPPRQILRVVDLRDGAAADRRGDDTGPEPDPPD